MDPRRNEGFALVISLLAVVLVSAFAAALVLTTSTEIRIAANFSTAEGALYAAESAVERAIQDLQPSAGWNPALDGTAQSTFLDGLPSGPRRLNDGSAIDLNQVLNMANCEKAAGCTAAEMNDVTGERPWGANNPRWRLFAYGPLGAMQPPGRIESPFYVVAMVGDDPAENDNDPDRDGIDATNPGTGVIALRGEAFGPGGAHAIVEATIARVADADGHVLPGVRVLTWRSNP
jgi:Tfp pilus assembly protein PilX